MTEELEPTTAEERAEWKNLLLGPRSGMYGVTSSTRGNTLRLIADVARLEIELERRAPSYSGINAEEIILLRIQGERMLQSRKWTLEHDCEHTPEEWQSLIVERMARPLPDIDDYAYEKRFVQVAALAVAALEARAALEPKKE